MYHGISRMYSKTYNDIDMIVLWYVMNEVVAVTILTTCALMYTHHKTVRERERERERERHNMHTDSYTVLQQNLKNKYTLHKQAHKYT